MIFIEGDWTSMTLRFETPELATQAKQSFLSHILPVNLQCEYLEGPPDMGPAKPIEHYMRPPSPPPVVTIVDCYEDSRPTSRSDSLTPPPFPLPCSPRTQSESSAPSRLMTPESWTTEAPSIAQPAASSAPVCGLERALLRAEERAESRIDALLDAREKLAALNIELRYSQAEAQRYKAENNSLRERGSQQGGDNQNTQQLRFEVEQAKAQQQRRTNDDNDWISDSSDCWIPAISDTLSVASTTKTEHLARRAEAVEEALDVERHEWGTEKCRLQDQLSAWESRRNEWEMDKHEMELQVESLQSDLECLTKLLHESDMQGVDLAHDLHCKTEQIDHERWDWIDEKAKLQDQLAAWESRREEWDMEKHELGLHAEALQLDLADCSRKLHDSESEMRSMLQRQNERAAVDAEIIKDLQVRLAAAQKAQRRVQDMDAIMLDREEEWSAEKEGLELQVADLSAKNAELETEKINLVERLEKCEKDMGNQSIVESELRELFHESETRGDRCEEDLEAAIGDQNLMAEQLDEASEEKASLRAERDELAKRVTDLESIVEAKEVTLNDLETKVQPIAGLTRSLEERTAELQAAQEKTKLVKAALSRTIDDCKAGLALGAENYGKLAGQFSKAKAEATAAAAKKDAAVEMSEKARGLIEKKLAAREEELAQKAKDLGAAQRKVNELSRELKKEKEATGKVERTSPGTSPYVGGGREGSLASFFSQLTESAQRPHSWAAPSGQ
ncbi:hypothetical protein CYLTODRAFT_234283 [Cylindrobasidium torrendii FP15055 ss-10]|uniref:Uncharacterized protein n=1 Tax=Cylindrobasidium torrendii FP15055 ss-10 TaxID=1314674 RepID=A0A0D7BHZ7_9AGAR|nr:hypothetical protein CYLTODRAFT_234283 [Cylindrobasidium torrendii FP15055 ss-10]